MTLHTLGVSDLYLTLPKDCFLGKVLDEPMLRPVPGGVVAGGVVAGGVVPGDEPSVTVKVSSSMNSS